MIDPAREHPKTEHAPRSVFWLCFWLAVLLIAAKSVNLGLPPNWSASRLADYATELAIVAHADVFFALCLGVVGHLVLGLSSRRSRVERLKWSALVALCLSCAIYGIASVQVFAYLRTPLTYPLMYLAGDLKNMRSSLGAFVTPALLVALVIGPAAVLLLAAASWRLIRMRRTRWAQSGG